MKSFVGKPLSTKAGQLAFINPGAGPVEGAFLGYARQNISQLILDAGFKLEQVEIIHHSKYDDSGRFFFQLKHNGRTCEVEIPGLDLSLVRYLISEEQNIWDFPRLYVNGSSFVWLFAISLVRESLLSIMDDD